MGAGTYIISQKYCKWKGGGKLKSNIDDTSCNLLITRCYLLVHPNEYLPSPKRTRRKSFLHLRCSPALLISNLSENGRCGSARRFIYSPLFKPPQPWIVSLVFRQDLTIFWGVSFRTACLDDILDPCNEDIVFRHRGGNEQALDVHPPLVRTEPGDMAT